MKRRERQIRAYKSIRKSPGEDNHFFLNTGNDCPGLAGDTRKGEGENGEGELGGGTPYRPETKKNSLEPTLWKSKQEKNEDRS